MMIVEVDVVVDHDDVDVVVVVDHYMFQYPSVERELLELMCHLAYSRCYFYDYCY